jgi:hypothetical protein
VSNLGYLFDTDTLVPFIKFRSQAFHLAVFVVLLMSCHTEVIKRYRGEVIFPASVLVKFLQLFDGFFKILLFECHKYFMLFF